MAGRRPKPTALKLIEGNPGKRPQNKREPKPKVGMPVCPRYLSNQSKVVWKKLVEILEPLGVLTGADALALERLCDCYADILANRELIERDGRTYITIDAQGNKLIKNNPAVNQLRAADSQFKSYLVEFGLTPAARSKIQVTGDDDNHKQDPLQEFFG